MKIPDDVIDFTPAMRAEGLNMLKRYRTDQSPYVPYILGDVNGLLGSINIGNTGGGTNWPGAGLDPEIEGRLSAGQQLRRDRRIARRRAAGLSPTSVTSPA